MEKTRSLPTQEQDANFEFLVNILDTAKTYKEAKAVWFQLRKIQEKNKDAWVLSFAQNQEILHRYNELKFGKFAADHEAEVRAQEALALEIVREIEKAKTLSEMHVLSTRIYKEIRMKDIKEQLQETYRKAFQELRSA